MTNALFIYGLAFYEGYVEGLGFDSSIFFIEWGEAILWTYHASRELGVASILLLGKVPSWFGWAFFVLVYLLLRISIYIFSTEPRRTIENKNNNFTIAKKIYFLRGKHPIVYKFLYRPVKWLFIAEQSVIAFIALYFSLLIALFLPVFILVWVYFPIIGVNHGERVANDRLEFLSKNLCGDKNDKWNQCIELSVENTKNEHVEVVGRIIATNDDIVGMYTKDGPLTFIMPKKVYFKKSLKSLFKVDCNETVEKKNI